MKVDTKLRIAGVVAAVPARAVANADIPGAERASIFTGVKQRRHLSPGQSLMDLEVAATRCLLANVGWGAANVGFLVHVSQTPRSTVPAGAYDLHHSLGLQSNCVVVPVNWSCAGYVMGLYTASVLLASAPPRTKVLLVVGDATSTMCRRDDYGTYPLFGDATSATALTTGPNGATFVMGSDGGGRQHLSATPGGYLSMYGPEVFRFALSNVPSLVETLLSASFFTPDTVLFHQASATMLASIQRKISWGTWCARRPHMPSNIAEFGNCSSASIPLLWTTDSAKRGSSVLGPSNLSLVGFGAGWAWAGANITVPEGTPTEYIEV